MTESETFVSTLLSASVKDGVIRLEFGDIEEAPENKPGNGERRNAPKGAQKGAQKSAQKNVKTLVKHRLIMPISGFVRSQQLMQEVVTRLEQEKKDS